MNLRDVDGLEGLDDFLENASLSIHIVGPDGQIIWANEAELKTLGYQYDEYVGKPIAEFHADDETISDILTRLTNNQVLRNYKARLLCKDGTTKHVLINSNVYMKDGEFIHTRCFTRDITDLVTQEDTLKRNVTSLESLNQQLDEFTYMASHDLKEALRGIKFLSSTLREDCEEALDPSALERFDMLGQHTTHLANLIDTLMTYSRLGKEDIVFENIDTDDILSDCHSLLSARITEKNAEVSIQKNLPCIVGNIALISDVFINLISNSIKYNTNEKPTIKVASLVKNDEVIFFVKDNGIGIAPKHHETIFKIFKRLHNHEKYGGGTGAGLTIVKKIIEIHDGNIWVESSEEGSTFFFTLNNKKIKSA